MQLNQNHGNTKTLWWMDYPLWVTASIRFIFFRVYIKKENSEWNLFYNSTTERKENKITIHHSFVYFSVLMHIHISHILKTAQVQKINSATEHPFIVIELSHHRRWSYHQHRSVVPSCQRVIAIHKIKIVQMNGHVLFEDILKRRKYNECRIKVVQFCNAHILKSTNIWET